ncbi:hypothetical protein VPH35_122037 [Triticum aestivum]
MQALWSAIKLPRRKRSCHHKQPGSISVSWDIVPTKHPPCVSAMSLMPWFGGGRGGMDPFSSDLWDPFSSDLWDPFGASWPLDAGRRGGEGGSRDDATAMARTNIDWHENDKEHIFSAEIPGKYVVSRVLMVEVVASQKSFPSDPLMLLPTCRACRGEEGAREGGGGGRQRAQDQRGEDAGGGAQGRRVEPRGAQLRVLHAPVPPAGERQGGRHPVHHAGRRAQGRRAQGRASPEAAQRPLHRHRLNAPHLRMQSTASQRDMPSPLVPLHYAWR